MWRFCFRSCDEIKRAEFERGVYAAVKSLRLESEMILSNSVVGHHRTIALAFERFANRLDEQLRKGALFVLALFVAAPLLAWLPVHWEETLWEEGETADVVRLRLHNPSAETATLDVEVSQHWPNPTWGPFYQAVDQRIRIAGNRERYVPAKVTHAWKCRPCIASWTQRYPDGSWRGGMLPVYRPALQSTGYLDVTVTGERVR